MFGRRQILAGGAMLAAGSIADAATPAAPSLAALARAKGIRFGSTLGKDNFADSAYRALTSSKRISVTIRLISNGSAANSVTPHSHASSPTDPVMI